MRILELFAGTRSIGKAFERKGHEVISVEYDADFDNIKEYCDIEYLTSDYLKSKYGNFDVIWASPDCTTYSIAAISHHRRKVENDLIPVSEYAQKCDRVNKNMIKLINDLKPNLFFIENPRGGFRKMKFINDLNITRYTVTYCQYGDTRMKPTDIFSNIKGINFKPMCKNGDPCHVSAPRGSRTGTQGLKKVDRSKIPDDLCNFVVEICEEYIGD